MWPNLIILPKPNIDGDLGLSCGVEPFSVEHFFCSVPLKLSLCHLLGKQCPTLFSQHIPKVRPGGFASV